MLELVSVEVENFRAFTSAQFTPARSGEGLTAIVGENGSGKSSIVTALLFCLYGITPEGVTISGLRKQDTTEPVIVRTTMMHNNQTLIVERSIRGTTDKTTAKIILNGEEQTDISSRVATQWIVKETGLNAESFTSAFVVKQKELDSLVKARPAERRKTIERLAGVERMSKAVTYAREELKIKRAALENMNTTTFNMEDIESRISELEKSNKTLREENNTTIEKLKEKNKEKERIEGEILIVKGLNNDNKDITHQEELKKQKLDNLIKDINKNTNLAEEVLVDGKLPNVETLEIELENISEEINRLESAKTLHDETQRQLKNTSEEITTTTTTLDDLRTILSTLKTDKINAHNTLSTFDEDALNDEQHALVQESESTKSDIAILTNDISVAEETLNVFAEHLMHQTPNADEKVTCPTCTQTVEDVEKLHNRLTESVHQKTKLLHTKKEQCDIINKKLENIETEKGELVNITNQVEKLQQKITQVEEKIFDKELELDKKTATRNELEEKLQHSTSVVEKYSTTMKNLTTAFKEYNEKIVQAENATKALQENEHLTYERDEILEQRVALQVRKKNNEEALSKHEPLKVLEKHRNSNADAIIELDKSISTKENIIKMQESEIRNEEKLKAHATAAEEKVKELKKDIEILETTTSVLSEFRKDRLARLSPELSEITSDLLSEMTNGKYNIVEFDEDFTPYITNDIGETRPVTWLSGGEESLVALALRVGVGEILAGGRNGNLLVLDEVLTAQDKARRAATLGALRNLNRQTIVINHIEEATDIADKLVYVVPPGEGGEYEGSQLTTAM